MSTENLEKINDYVVITVEYQFTDEELAMKAQHLATLIGEIELQEAKKRAVTAEYKNKIDNLKAEAKLISGHLINKWANVDRACELYLDFEHKVRVYDDKITGNELKREPFHQSDFEKRQLALNMQEQIDENNTAGNFAEGLDALDEVIVNKKLGRDKHGNLTDIDPVSFDDIS